MREISVIITLTFAAIFVFLILSRYTAVVSVGREFANASLSGINELQTGTLHTLAGS